jgi:hypothetical protein
MKIAIAGAAAAVWLGVAGVWAASMLTERARGAPLQMVGRCDSCSSRWEGGSIYSYCELSVLRLIRGAPGADAVVVRQRGGEVDGVAQKVSHLTVFRPGEKYLLFLDHDQAGSWVPVAKGVHPIVEAPDQGETVGGQALDEVIRDLGGER